ncbi:MAG: hypothetical protein EP300_05205 [Gammaproteobacteria bacterium]|nr:MAG: hypothetical protein EP300_05205 [Gammaproteobacteria bacterium]
MHLGLSIVIFIVMVYQIYYNWYPQPYFSIDGGWQGVRIVAAVDLVLGPLITFLIFDLSKSRREIVLDLITIVTIQLGALSYGIYQTHSQRPVLLAQIGQFMISATMEQVDGKVGSASDLYLYSDEKPPIIYADLQLDQKTMAEIANIDLWNNVLEYVQTQSKDPKSEFVAAIKSMQPELLRLLDAFESREPYQAWLQQNNKKQDEIMVSRFVGRYGAVWLVFDLDGKLLSYFADASL